MRDPEKKPESVGEAVMKVLRRWDSFDPYVLQDRDPEHYLPYVWLEASIEELRDQLAQIIDCGKPN